MATLTKTELGVLKLMKDPQVIQAVEIVIAHGKRVAEMGAIGDDPSAMPSATSMDTEPPEPEQIAPPVKKGPAKLPTIDAMQAAGYQGSAGALRGTWSWAKEFGKDHVVWPTPTSGFQEALRFDQHGWPHAETTPEEWVTLIGYWTVLREQMACGASRTQRGAMDSAFGKWM